jgi:hypothetical protein
LEGSICGFFHSPQKVALASQSKGPTEKLRPFTPTIAFSPKGREQPGDFLDPKAEPSNSSHCFHISPVYFG